MNQQLSSDTSKNPCTYELQFASDFSVLFNADQTLISKNIILKTSLFISKLCKNKLHHVPLTRLHINRSCFINTLTNVSFTLSLSFSLNLYNEACATQVHQASSNPTLYYPL